MLVVCHLRIPKIPSTSPRDPITSSNNSITKHFNKNDVGLTVVKSDTKNLSEKLNKTVWRRLIGSTEYNYFVFLLDENNTISHKIISEQSYEFTPLELEVLYSYKIIKDTPTELHIENDRIFYIYGLVADNKFVWESISVKHHTSTASYNAQIKIEQDKMTTLLAKTEDTTTSVGFDKTIYISQNIINKD